MRHYRGWTLIEVLVVVAILAVLAAIVYVLMAPAREKGRQTSCMSNLRQIGVAVTMYRSDYEGSRGGGPASSVRGSKNVWARLGVPPDPYRLVDTGYVTDVRIFHCPHDPRAKELYRTALPPGKTIRDYKVYSFNWCPLTCFMEDQYPGVRQGGVPYEAYNRLYREKGERIVLSFDWNHWMYHSFDPKDPVEKKLERMNGFFLRLDGSVQRINFAIPNIPPRDQGGMCGL